VRRAIIGLLCLVMTGCGASMRDSAIVSANVAHDVEETLGAMLHTQCTQGYEKASTPVAIAKLDSTCLPARKVYGALRTARVVLQAALTDTVPAGEAELARDAAALAVATKQAAQFVRAMQEAP
jgi:hypothetical protein